NADTASVNPSLRMRFQELRLAFIVELDETGTGEAAVQEVQIGSGPVLDRIVSHLADLVEADDPSATLSTSGGLSIYTWNDVTYSIQLGSDGKPISGIVTRS